MAFAHTALGPATGAVLAVGVAVGAAVVALGAAVLGVAAELFALGAAVPVVGRGGTGAKVGGAVDAALAPTVGGTAGMGIGVGLTGTVPVGADTVVASGKCSSAVRVLRTNTK
jgi:hypothetical protein